MNILPLFPRFIFFFVFLFVFFSIKSQSSYHPDHQIEDQYPAQNIQQQGQFFTESILPLDSTVIFSSQNNRLTKTAYKYNADWSLQNEMTYQYSTDNQWETASRVSYQYDADNNIVDESEYIFDKTTDDFILKYQNQYQYDAYKNVTKETYYYLNEITATLQGNTQYETNFDKNGDPLQRIISVWNEMENNWQPFQKFVYAYSTTGKQILSEEYKYKSNTHEWIKVSKSALQYDANDNLVLQEYAVGDEISNRWENYSKIESEYVSNQLTNEIILKANKTGNLINSTKTDFVYFPSGKLNTSVTSQFDAVNSTWNEAFKYAYTYDANNNPETINHYIKTTPSSTWANVFKSSYVISNLPRTIEAESFSMTPEQKWTGNVKKITSYDAQSRLKGIETYFWDDTISNWMPASKDIIEYNANNLLDFIEKYSGDSENQGVWNGYHRATYDYELQGNNYVITQNTLFNWESENWTEDTHTTYYYGIDTITAVKENNSKTKIYWSPDETIRINAAKEMQAVAIYSITGKQVHQSSGKRESIPTSSWSKGIYAVKVSFEDGTWTTEKVYVR